ncbi:MAG: transporter [Mangrovibacterium sp.]
MKQLFSTVILIIFSFISMAQESIINTDRPDHGDGVSTVPANRFQVEEGITLAKKTFANNLLIRYGIGNTTEARLVVDAGKYQDANGLQPISFSMKQRLYSGKNWVPAITAVGYISLGDWASSDFKSSENQLVLKLSFANQLSEKLSLGYNVGTYDFDHMNTTIGLAYALAGKISVFGEYFASWQEHANEHNIGAGILYLINNQLQVDAAIGSDIFDGQNNRFFSTIGVSYLF